MPTWYSRDTCLDVHACSVPGPGADMYTQITYLGSQTFHPCPQSHWSQHHDLPSAPQAACLSLPRTPLIAALVWTTVVHTKTHTEAKCSLMWMQTRRDVVRKVTFFKVSLQYLFQGRDGALLLLLQGLDLLKQAASLQTEPSDLLKHLLVFGLTQTTTTNRTNLTSLCCVNISKD